MPSDRRKKKLVNISVQKAIALRIICHSLLFVWSVFLVCLGLLIITGVAQTDEAFIDIRMICLLAIGVSTLVVLPAITYDSVKFSHRMAGPVMRLKNILPKIGVEKLDHVRLRKNDFWQEFVIEVNAMLDRIEILREREAALEASVRSTSLQPTAEQPTTEHPTAEQAPSEQPTSTQTAALGLPVDVGTHDATYAASSQT